VIDLYFTDPSGIQGKQKVLALLQEQLAETERKLAELSSFRDDLQRNIARIEYLIEQAGQSNR
jgi:septal ring factor EnvC (AmiA/AmiB activator)